jgi:isopropylmalate/homocitrate/citramalate synthase
MTKSDDKHEPNLLRHLFPSYRVPRASFAEAGIPLSVPQAISCVDSTFALGAPALRAPSMDDATAYLDLLGRLSSHSGLLRRVELAVDLASGQELLARLLAHHREESLQIEPVALLPHPSREVIGKLEGLNVKEAGLMFGASDYQRPSLTRAAEDLVDLIEACVEKRIRPRLDLTDATRCDAEAFVLPLVETCQEHMARRGLGALRLRLYDTLGLGLPWSEAPVPRSVPRLLRLVAHHLGLQPDQLEFAGSNDLGLSLANTLSAAVNGCGGLVCTVGGVGERAGVAPLEQALIHLSGLFGGDCDLTVVTQIISLLASLGLKPGKLHPLWGEAGLTTSLIPSKLPVEESSELYAPFDTARLIGRLPEVAVLPTSGTMGIAHLLHQNLPQAGLEHDDEAVRCVLDWVIAEGLTGPLEWEQIEPKVRELLPQHFAAEEPADS